MWHKLCRVSTQAELSKQQLNLANHEMPHLSNSATTPSSMTNTLLLSRIVLILCGKT